MKLVFVLVLAGACTAREPGAVTAGDLKVHGAFSFAPPTPSEAAGYFTVVNSGRQADTLLSVTSPIAAGAMLHGQAQDGGMIRMTHLEAPVVPAADSLVLAPGGTHLMLMTLDRLPKPGDSVPVTLTFSRAGTVAIMLPVRAYSDAP